MKHYFYNEVCVTIVGKDGDHINIPLAIGYIHKETTNNFA